VVKYLLCGQLGNMKRLGKLSQIIKKNYFNIKHKNMSYMPLQQSNIAF